MEKSEVDILGVVQVPLQNLQFVEGVGERLHNTRQTERLQTLFECNSADHENSRHWIDGYIDNAEAPSFLNKLGLSRQDLNRHNLDGNSLALMTTSCASLRVATGSKRQRILTHMSGGPLGCHHETPDSDGRVYCKLREYGDGSLEFHEWHQRLSKSKQYIFQRLTQRVPMMEALDLLGHFPAVVDFLQLGCYSSVFDNRIFGETIAGWNLIYTGWSRLTLGSRFLQHSIDRDTVLALEGRAPAASKADQLWIHQAFASGQVWPGITDPQQRRELEYRVQSFEGIIPSLKWLQANLLYLNVAAGII
ncbi:hypothetical protein VFPPC_11561 [Pochonia chlamydosporia 170]|uniref:Uncharacterized protein n=1 Tax=Pochonia chlamydosporia 170 TaxID=1380566 RepID=A0A179EZ07_METCM|nr:hypothetical protein VFPPC_11561 [Pochonia chlamydosporia 170]OAQ58435.1 hypothetical protein VFPPC_11561 [Pochonia chlamydosporia 170]